MASINQKSAINTEKTKHLGKLFHTIDFVVTEDASSEGIRNLYKNQIVGNFEIGNSSFKLTLGELERIHETSQNAIDVFFKKYQLGLYGK